MFHVPQKFAPENMVAERWRKGKEKRDQKKEKKKKTREKIVFVDLSKAILV